MDIQNKRPRGLKEIYGLKWHNWEWIRLMPTLRGQNETENDINGNDKNEKKLSLPLNCICHNINIS